MTTTPEGTSAASKAAQARRDAKAGQTVNVRSTGPVIGGINAAVRAANKASGGTTTSTYRDQYTNPLNPGESALEEAARLEAAGVQKILDRVAVAAGTAVNGKAASVAKTVYPRNVQYMKDNGMDYSMAPRATDPKTIAIYRAKLANPTGYGYDAIYRAVKIVGDYDKAHPQKVAAVKVGAPAISQLPPPPAPTINPPNVGTTWVEYIPQGVPAADIISQGINQVINTIAQYPAEAEPVPIDLTPGFNLGISDGSLLGGVKDALAGVDLTPGFNLGVSDGSRATDIKRGLEGVVEAIANPPSIGATWKEYIPDLTPGFNLGISDGSLPAAIKDTADKAKAAVNLIQPTTPAQAARVSPLLLVLGAGLLWVATKKKRR